MHRIDGVALRAGRSAPHDRAPAMSPWTWTMRRCDGPPRGPRPGGLRGRGRRARRSASRSSTRAARLARHAAGDPSSTMPAPAPRSCRRRGPRACRLGRARRRCRLAPRRSSAPAPSAAGEITVTRQRRELQRGEQTPPGRRRRRRCACARWRVAGALAARPVMSASAPGRCAALSA